MLSLHKLDVFATVVHAGSFSAAADQLYMTQSAVSQHIQDLEASLGTRLFKRGRRGVTLTPAGETLHDYTRNILRLVAEAESAVTDVAHLTSGQVTIGTTPGISVYLLPEWIQTFRQRFPNLSIALQTAVTAEIVAGVLSHRLDVGFVEGEINAYRDANLGQLALQTIEQYVIVGRGHTCWVRDSVPVESLDGQPFITRQPNSQTRIWMDEVLGQHGIRPRYIAELDNPESIKRAVMTGMGVTILPDYAVHHEVEAGLLRALPLEGIPLRRTLKLVWDQQHICTPITRAFLTHLSDRFPNLIDFIAGRVPV